MEKRPISIPNPRGNPPETKEIFLRKGSARLTGKKEGDVTGKELRDQDSVKKENWGTFYSKSLG